VLDSLLVEAAVEAGVELRTGFAVRELVSDAHGVSGIVGQGERGIVCREPASLVVGADGMRSLVARAVQAPVYDAYPPLTCNYFSYFAGVPIHRAELFSRPGLFVIASPTHEGLTQVIVIRPRGEFRPLRTLTDAQFLAFLEGLPRLSELVRGGRRVERFYGTADLPFYFRKPYGPGWALAGDAGHFKDPITAQGMTNAFQQAILLAEAALSIFNGHQSFDEAMREYEFTRNAETRSMYDFTRELAKLHSPPPDVERILRATSERPGTADQFFGILGGSVSKEEFFASASANTEGVLHRASRGQRLPCPGGPRPARHF
jgi:2-polyprenyl-6-methoxyphenol hydroxylase-like FAD-dependent oxidoreductase